MSLALPYLFIIFKGGFIMKLNDLCMQIYWLISVGLNSKKPTLIRYETTGIPFCSLLETENETKNLHRVRLKFDNSIAVCLITQNFGLRALRVSPSTLEYLFRLMGLKPVIVISKELKGLLR
jgi:hypothetical protein